MTTSSTSLDEYNDSEEVLVLYNPDDSQDAQGSSLESENLFILMHHTFYNKTKTSEFFSKLGARNYLSSATQELDC